MTAAKPRCALFMKSNTSAATFSNLLRSFAWSQRQRGFAERISCASFASSKRAATRRSESRPLLFAPLKRTVPKNSETLMPLRLCFLIIFAASKKASGQDLIRQVNQTGQQGLRLADPGSRAILMHLARVFGRDAEDAFTILNNMCFVGFHPRLPIAEPNFFHDAARFRSLP